MRIYITDLEAYNRGHLVGAWYTLPMGEDGLCECNEEVLYQGRKACEDTHHHEETFITDYEAIITIDEYDDIYRLNELAQKLEAFSDDDLLKLKFLSYEGYNEREVIDNGIDSYEVTIYDYSTDISFTDVYEMLAYDLVAEGLFGEIPDHLENYIDYSAIGRDLSCDYTEFEHGILGRVA
jgi:antirestriction protein